MVSPERAVVNSVRPQNVDTVMVNGRVVKSRGSLTVADARHVGEEAARSLKAILQRAG
jgi:hypothetical protein